MSWVGVELGWCCWVWFGFGLVWFGSERRRVTEKIVNKLVNALLPDTAAIETSW